MRPMDANTLNALTGSRSGDGVVVYAWYNGQLAYPDPLPVDSWRFDWDTSRQVQTFDVTLADKDGTLAPWLLEDPLGVGGTRLQVMYRVGGAGTVNMGWYRVTQSVPDEVWRSYTITEKGRINPDSPVPQDKRLVYVSGGARVKLSASDLGVVAVNSRMLAPESPQGGSPTIVGEVRRLMDGIAPVVTATGVTDRAVNKTLVYEQDRLNAVQDLCKRISCDYRFNGNGQLEIYPLAGSAPVWKIAGGPEGVLVSVNRAQKLDGLYNMFIADGTASNAPVRGAAQIATGPLRVDGPHGRYPKFYSSNMLTTQAEADAYANEMMTTQIAGLTVELQIVCLPHPGLQQGDWVTVASPVINTQEVALSGRVTKIGLRGTTAPDRMSLTVECSYSDVQTVMGGVFRG